MRRGLFVLLVLLPAGAASAQLPPPPGMVRTAERTVSCARTLAKVGFTISSNGGGPLAIDAADHRQYASIGLRTDRALIRTAAAGAAALGRRWNLREQWFETKQFSCALRGPLVVHVRAGPSVSRFAAWTARGRALALGELGADGRGWLRVARACTLSYSR